MSLRLELKGVEELKRKFREIGKDFEEAAAASLIAAGFVVSNDAKRNAPRITGNLKRSIFPSQVKEAQPITDEVEPPPVQNLGTVKRQFQQGGKATLYVGTNVVYAKAQEFLPYKHKHGTSPYLRPALENNRAEVQRVFTVAMRQVISRAGRG